MTALKQTSQLQRIQYAHPLLPGLPSRCYNQVDSAVILCYASWSIRTVCDRTRDAAE